MAVSIDEVLVLAYVLGVAPVHIFVPLSGYVRIGDRRLPAKRVRPWVSGTYPLREADGIIYRQEVPRSKRVFPDEIGRG